MRMTRSAPEWYLEDIRKGYYGKSPKFPSRKTIFHESVKKRYISTLTFKNGNSLLMTPKPLGFGRDSTIQDYMSNLKDKNVKTIIVLLESHEERGLIKNYEDNGFEVIHFPIKDFNVPKDMGDLSRVLHVIRNRLARHSVAMHCFGGNGRTGLVAASMLVQMGLESEKAIRTIRKYRPEAIETKDQEQFIYEYENYLSLR